MQKFRPSGQTSSQKLPAEKRPQMHPQAWPNTGRASSGRVGAIGLYPPTTAPPPFPPSCIEHTLLEYTLPWHFFWLVFPFERTTPSFLDHFSLHDRTASSLSICPYLSGLSNHHRCMCVWFGCFISLYFKQKERTKSFICNIAEGRLCMIWFFF